jgi:hypothetical protein
VLTHSCAEVSAACYFSNWKPICKIHNHTSIMLQDENKLACLCEFHLSFLSALPCLMQGS